MKVMNKNELWEDIFFWLGIMRDHADFQIMSFSPREMFYAQTAQNFKNAFINLRNRVKRVQQSSQRSYVFGRGLLNDILGVLISFINFKRILIRQLLLCNIELSLPPTFVNHMINEAVDFYYTICNPRIITNPTMVNICLHRIWLPDAYGHAAAIASMLDPTEKMLIEEAREFKNTFVNLYIKANELGIMLERTGLSNSTLDQLNNEVKNTMDEFIHYLQKIRRLRALCRTMGTIAPLLPDHMIREERYYLSKIKNLR